MTFDAIPDELPDELPDEPSAELFAQAPGTGPVLPAPTRREWRRAALSALSQDPRSLAPVVDGYEVGRLLGSGGSAVVWAGTGVDGVERALKVLQPDVDGDLLAELSMLRRVRHPRVVAVHDISTDADGRPVLVLDLAAGGSLAALAAQRRRLSAGEVSGLLAVLGPALEDLHAADVVHGDIAPGNVLLDARGEPLLADLGVSRALGRRHGSVLGTPGFADPAALAGDGVGAASDVYGLAALGWWALTGQTPSPTGPVGARLAQRRALAGAGSASTAPNAAGILDALREGLHRKPSRRPTPGELADAVGRAARPRPVRGLTLSAPTSAPTSAATPAAVPLAGGPAATPAPPPGATRRISTPDLPVAEASAPAPASARPSPARSASRRRAAPVRRRVPRLLVLAGVLPVVAGGALVLALQAGAEEQRTDDAGATVSAPVVSEPSAPRVVAEPSAEVAADATTQDVATQDATTHDLAGATAAPAGSEVLRGDDALAVVSELADRRARALSSLDAGGLDLVDVAGSSARSADDAVLAGLRDAGATYEALAFDVVAARDVSRDEDRWVLEADVVTAEHVVVAVDGTRQTVAATEPRTSRLTLTRVEGEWRISAVG